MITNFKLFEGRTFNRGEDILFQYTGMDTIEDEIIVKGILTYKGEDFFGNFSYYPDGQSYWSFSNNESGEFEPESDDFYEMDSLMQEVEAEYVK